MENERLKFLAELLGEGAITRAEYDFILSRKFKMCEILEEFALERLPPYDIRPPVSSGPSFAH